MAINVPGPRYDCHTCRAVWSDGRWTWGCEECGGASMTVPCGESLGSCGHTWHRAAMDSNDSGRAHLFGRCGDPASPLEKLRRWQQVETVVKAQRTPLLRLRVALLAFSSDAAWKDSPRGPGPLQVVLDGVLEHGLSPSPRALAHASFSWERPSGAGLPSLPLERFWRDAGSLVLLEPLLAASPTELMTRVKVLTVVGEGSSWLSEDLLDDVPCAVPTPLHPGQRYLGVLVPSNRVAGLLLTDVLPVAPEQEAAVLDWHRERLARGDRAFARR